MVEKTVIVTGGNRGLGLECALALATHQEWQVVLAVRDIESGRQAAQKITNATGNGGVAVRQLDLASLSTVRAFAADFVAEGHPPLRAIVCNAGISQRNNQARSVDGYELTFAINHLGHFLLVNLLLETLQAPGRIIFVSSGLHAPNTWRSPRYVNAYALAYPERDPIPDEKPDEAGGRAYSTSKLCNVWCAYEMVRRLEAAGLSTPEKPITVNAYNPGLMPATGLNRDGSALSLFFWRYILPRLGFLIPALVPVEESGRALADLVTDPSFEGQTGKYYFLSNEEPSSDDSYDEAKAAALWQASVALAGLKLEETPLPH